MTRGRFIVFEGIDGSGKSTQARLLAEALRARGRAVCFTREPTDASEAGRRLRQLAREGRDGVSLERETALYQEDRAQHCKEVVVPALARGEIVISDRYWFSTVAYQGALGADGEAVATESRKRFPTPDLVVYLRIAPRDALSRIHASRPDGPAAAYEKSEFLEKVLARYEEQIGPDWLVLDATGAQEALAEKTLSRALSLLDPA